MVGKTSLIKAALNEMKHRKTLYVNFLGVSSLGGATKAIIEQVNRQKGFWQKLGEKIAGTDSFMVSKEGVSWSGKGAPSQTLRRVLAGLADRKNPTVVAFDEVQEIYPAAAQLIKVLKNVWDTEGGGILFVFSGSKFGLLRAMEKETAMSGRPPAEMRLHLFTQDESKAFLKAGAAQMGKTLTDSQLQTVVDELDGIVGWLTLFGNYYAIRNQSFEEALRAAKREGKKIVRGEYKHFLKGRNRKVCDAILQVLSPQTEFTWAQIKNATQTIIHRKLNNNSFNNTLNSLIDAEFVTEVISQEERRSRRTLKIVDPLLASAMTP